MERLFYYTPGWDRARRALVGAEPEHMLRGSIRLTPTPHGKLVATVNDYVAGTPLERMVRPVGGSSDPPFKTLHPSSPPCVWYLRTWETRTFGWFVRPNAFVALFMELKENLAADPTLYQRYGSQVMTVRARFPGNEVSAEIEAKNVVK